MVITFQTLPNGRYRGKITMLDGRTLFGQKHHAKKGDATKELMDLYPKEFDIAE